MTAMPWPELTSAELRSCAQRVAGQARNLAAAGQQVSTVAQGARPIWGGSASEGFQTRLGFRRRSVDSLSAVLSGSVRVLSDFATKLDEAKAHDQELARLEHAVERAVAAEPPAATYADLSAVRRRRQQNYQSFVWASMSAGREIEELRFGYVRDDLGRDLGEGLLAGLGAASQLFDFFGNVIDGRNSDRPSDHDFAPPPANDDEGVVAETRERVAKLLVGIPVKIGSIKLGGEVGVDTNRYLDGRVRVTLSGAGIVGVEAGSQRFPASAGVTGQLGGEVDFLFANQPDADAFIEDLRRQTVPTAGEVVTRAPLDALRLPGGVGGDAAADAARTLGRYENYVVDRRTAFGLEATGELKSPFGSGSLEGSAVRSVSSVTGVTEDRYTFTGEAKTGLGLGANGRVELELTDTSAHGTLQQSQIKVTGEISGGAGASFNQILSHGAATTGTTQEVVDILNGGDLAAHNLRGYRGELTVTLDHTAATDAATRRAFDDVVNGRRTFAQAWPDLSGKVRLDISRYAVENSGFGGNVEVLSGEYSDQQRRLIDTRTFERGSWNVTRAPQPISVAPPGG